MKAPFRLVAAGALAMTLTLPLSACGGSGSDEGSGSGSSSGSDGKTVRLWLNGPDTPQPARDFLETEFEQENPGATLEIEEQQWTGLVEKLTTSLSSASESPDVVEVGNTQASTFTAVGAFADVTDDLPTWGGDDLLPGFVDAATVDGKTYAVPYYAGSKFVFYRKDLFAAAGITPPTTLDEFVSAATALKASKPDDPAFSGFYLPGKDWRNAIAFVWAKGGDIAVEDGGDWEAQLSSPQSQEGLDVAKTLFEQASAAGKDADETDPQVPFCAGEVAMVSAPGWLKGVMEDPETGCPDVMENVGAFALPGEGGEPAPVLLGGSDVAISAKSGNPDLARSLVGIMVGEDYQTMLGEAGLTPALSSLSSLLGDDEYAQASIAAASNAKLPPAAAGWAAVEGSSTMEDLYVGIASGADPAAEAKKADAAIDSALAR